MINSFNDDLLRYRGLNLAHEMGHIYGLRHGDAKLSDGRWNVMKEEVAIGEVNSLPNGKFGFSDKDSEKFRK